MAAGSLITSPFNRCSSMLEASEKEMRKSGGANTQGWVIRPAVWVDQWRRIHPIKPVQCVAESLDASPRTVEKWFSGEAKPSLDYVGPILNRYGLAFIVGAMAAPLPWLDDLAREEETKALIAKREALDAKLAEAWARRNGQ